MVDAKMPLFDSHAHLDMLVQRGLDIDEVVKSAFNSGLKGIIAIVCANADGEYADGLAVSADYPNIWCAAGVHPHAADIYNDSAASKLKSALTSAGAVALGEIGLDYHYNYSAPKAQRDAFARQMRLARELGLPVVIHTRNADDDMIAMLDGEGAKECGGVIHCFSSGEKLAQHALDLGMYLSFSGIVTFPKSAEIQTVAGWVPEERILCETDSPFLSPAPKRGGINTPEKVSFVANKVAALRNADREALTKKIYANTCRCFNISVDMEESDDK